MTERFDHYYSETPKSKLKVKNVQLNMKSGHEYDFKSPSGVFSFGKVNRPTKVFVENIVLQGKSVLDLGCGYGMVGIVVKKENPFISLYMSDINKRAVDFAKRNALAYNIEPDIRVGHLYDPWEEMTFDDILFNPPMAAGKKVWMEAVKKAPEYLKGNGALHVVAYHNKGGERIKKTMKECFGHSKTLVKSGGVRVYKSVLPENHKRFQT